MTHRCGHPYFRSKFAARLLPTFPDSASTAENAITTCGNAGPAFSIWLVYSTQSWVNYRMEATLSAAGSAAFYPTAAVIGTALWPPANSALGTQAATAVSPQLWSLALRTPASMTDIRVHGVNRVSFDSRLLPISLPNSKMPYRLRQWFRRTKTCGTATLPGATTPMAVIRAPTARLHDNPTTAPPCSRRRRRH